MDGLADDFALFLHHECDGDTPWVGGYESGAAAALGIIMMAFAIGEDRRNRRHDDEYCVACKSYSCCSDQGPLVGAC